MPLPPSTAETPSPPLGARVDLPDVLSTAASSSSPSLFRLDFAHDVRAKELRWVVFARGRRGAIAKLVFTVDPALGHAHVKSLSVHAQFRGRGLARVLFLACLSTLAEFPTIAAVRLEAEEDTKRHGRLVELYARWGFDVDAEAKILFLYNQNDCFRKVPMTLTFGARAAFPARPAPETWFGMLTLAAADGTCLVPMASGRIEARRDARVSPDALWQTLLGRDRGEISLRSVHGKFLCVEDSGEVLADRVWNSTWETFHVVPFRPGRRRRRARSPELPAAAATADEDPDDKDHDQNDDDDEGDKTSAGGVALLDFHGRYLCIDPLGQRVTSSVEPVPWDGGGDMSSLVCHKADAAPMHARILRACETRAFAASQRRKYGGLSHATLSLADALQALLVLTGDARAPTESWLLHHVLATAEAAREDGHPDWVQLVLFLRGLGMLFLLWGDDENAPLRSISPSEWMALVSTWLLDEPIPEALEYPQLNALNADHVAALDRQKQQQQQQEQQQQEATEPQAGDPAEALPWTPDAYLHCVLAGNATSLPTEALEAVRFWSLRLWHERGAYAHRFTTPEAAETRDWLQLLHPYGAVAKERMKAVDPERSLPYYLGLGAKYLPAELRW